MKTITITIEEYDKLKADKKSAEMALEELGAFVLVCAGFNHPNYPGMQTTANMIAKKYRIQTK